MTLRKRLEHSRPVKGHKTSPKKKQIFEKVSNLSLEHRGYMRKILRKFDYVNDVREGVGCENLVYKSFWPTFCVYKLKRRI